jgi:hypothetical protein
MAWNLSRLTIVGGMVLCRLTVVDGMAYVSSYISGWNGLLVVLQEWMAWPLDHLTGVYGMAFVSSYSSGWHGLCVVLH